MKLPKYWPVLEPENIYQGSWEGPPTEHGECRCWLGWLMAVREDAGRAGSKKAWDYLTDRSIAFLGRGGLAKWNDSTPKHIVAERWNAFGKHLGYDIDNPEDA